MRATPPSAYRRRASAKSSVSRGVGVFRNAHRPVTPNTLPAGRAVRTRTSSVSSASAISAPPPASARFARHDPSSAPGGLTSISDSVKSTAVATCVAVRSASTGCVSAIRTVCRTCSTRMQPGARRRSRGLVARFDRLAEIPASHGGGTASMGRPAPSPRPPARSPAAAQRPASTPPRNVALSGPAGRQTTRFPVSPPPAAIPPARPVSIRGSTRSRQQAQPGGLARSSRCAAAVVLSSSSRCGVSPFKVARRGRQVAEPCKARGDFEGPAAAVIWAGAPRRAYFARHRLLTPCRMRSFAVAPSKPQTQKLGLLSAPDRLPDTCQPRPRAIKPVGVIRGAAGGKSLGFAGAVRDRLGWVAPYLAAPEEPWRNTRSSSSLWTMRRTTC